MKSLSHAALAALLAAGTLVAAPASAQKAEATAEQRKFKISDEARTPISNLQKAVNAKQTEGVAELFAAADAVAKNSDEKYIVAHLRLQHAKNTGDNAAAKTAIEAILASGGADAAETAGLQEVLLGLAAQNDPKAAEELFARRVAADPNNLDAISGLARAKLELKKDGEALDLLQRAISVSKSSGKPAPEAWYRKALEIAYNQKNRSLALQLSRETLGLFPNAENLGNAITVYRDAAQLDKQAQIDLLRLMRSARVMTADGYQQLAYLVNEGGYPGEAEAVIKEGRSLGVLKGNAGADVLASAQTRIGEDRASLPSVEAKARAAANGSLALTTATAYAGYGDYAKAIELYRLALSKGGVDANLVNTRLGIALAQAGQKAEAEAAFKAVTGTRADLAGLWLAWLSQRS